MCALQTISILREDQHTFEQRSKLSVWCAYSDRFLFRTQWQVRQVNLAMTRSALFIDNFTMKHN